MISVLLPTYNSASLLDSSIKSILNQTFHDFELLILDDGSTDGTERIVSRFIDSRIRYVKYPHRGLPETLNAGLRESQYDLIARMDAGDVSLSERFEKQYSYISRQPLNTIVASRYAVFAHRKLQYLVSSMTDPISIRKQLALHPPFAHCGVMYYRKYIIDAGMYRNIPLEDYDLWLRIKDTANFHILDEVLLFVEYVEGRLSTLNLGDKYKNNYALQEPYYADLKFHFGISDKNEEYRYRGWREYFFGEKTNARVYWERLGIGFFKHPRVVIAWIVTFLPEVYFIKFKESRIKFRLKYMLYYFTRETKGYRKSLKDLLNG